MDERDRRVKRPRSATPTTKGPDVASIDDRWWTEITDGNGNVVEKIKTDRYGKGARWQVRWREPDTNKGRKLSFAKWKDADNKRKELEGDILRGQYVDPKAGTIPFDEYAAEWLANRRSDPLTIEATEGRLRRYVTGTALGKSPIGRIRPSTIQAWLKGLTVADSTARVVFDHVSGILAAAVDDGLISVNPCKSKAVEVPKRQRGELIPWTHEQVAAMIDNIADRYRPLVMLGAWLGLRAGETAGLAVDDVDFLRGVVTVRRQVKIVGNRRVFAFPKGGKIRTVPLSAALRDELAAYLAEYPTRSVTLPWRESGGEEVTARLILTNTRGEALHPATVTNTVWYPALAASGIERHRRNGTHALRHYYASSTLEHGGDIKALAAYLGHADPGFTLRVYGGLMPSSEERFKAAIDLAIVEVGRARRVA